MHLINIVSQCSRRCYNSFHTTEKTRFSHTNLWKSNHTRPLVFWSACTLISLGVFKHLNFAHSRGPNTRNLAMCFVMLWSAFSLATRSVKAIFGTQSSLWFTKSSALEIILSTHGTLTCTTRHTHTILRQTVVWEHWLRFWTPTVVHNEHYTHTMVSRDGGG